jgi:hypothetical protein
MQNTGQGSEKKSYRIILLLIVGLAAFSSAMKELNQIQAFTLETGQLIAQLTDSLPNDRNEMLVRVDTCDSKILPPLPAAPALPAVPPVSAVPAVSSSPAELEVDVPDVPQPAPPAPAAPRAKPRRVVRVEREVPITAKAEVPEVRVFISSEEVLNKALKDAFQADFNQKALKAKNRRHIMISPDGRDVILKSLNRSINLRAS